MALHHFHFNIQILHLSISAPPGQQPKSRLTNRSRYGVGRLPGFHSDRGTFTIDLRRSRTFRSEIFKLFIDDPEPYLFVDVHEEVVSTFVCLVLPHPQLFCVNELRLLLQVLLRYQDVIEESQGYIHSLPGTLLNLPCENLINEGTEDDESKCDGS